MTAMSSLCMRTATNFSSSISGNRALVTWTAAIISEGGEDVESTVPPSSFEHLSH